MGMFLDVSKLGGEAVVCGRVRPCLYEGGVSMSGKLTIENLTLQEAMDVLRALGSDTLATAKLGGVLPVASALVPRAPEAAPAASAPAPSPQTVQRPGPVLAAEVNQVAPAPAPASAPAPAPAPVQAPAVDPATDPFVEAPPVAAAAPSAPPPAPAAATSTPAPAAPPAAPVEAPAASTLPAEVASAMTLRPVIVYFYEQRGLRDLTSMCAALRENAKELKLVAKILQEDPTKLDARIEKTMVTMGYLS